jgi:hypothetical protein
MHYLLHADSKWTLYFEHAALPGDLVAHIKFTVLLMPNGSDRVTSFPVQELTTETYTEDPDVKAILALSTKSKKKGGGKKKKEKGELHAWVLVPRVLCASQSRPLLAWRGVHSCPMGSICELV